MSDANTVTPATGDADPTGEDVLEDAFLTYRDAGLRLPPVPRELVSSLQELAEGMYGTEATLDLSDVHGFLAAASDPSTPPQLAFGHVGHGVASWWFCYRLIRPSLALFIRLGYGGIDSSDDETRQIINRALALTEELVVAADEAAEAGKLQGRAIVVVDALEDAFIQIGPERTESTDPLADALQRIRA